jgi:nicotinamidase-related amidase
MLGSINHAIVEPLYEAMYFHGIARGTQPTLETKGGTAIVENYSVFKPEILKGPHGEVIGQRNAAFIRKVLDYDLVIFAGEAASHCVAWSIADFLAEIGQIDPSLTNKVAILKDCMSPVVIPNVIDYTDEANKALDSFEKAGMKLVTTADTTWLTA